MKTLKNWTLAAQHADHVELLVDERHRFCLYVLENDLFRVLIKREGELALDRTWSIAPQEDVPWEGAIGSASPASACRAISCARRASGWWSARRGCA